MATELGVTLASAIIVVKRSDRDGTDRRNREADLLFVLQEDLDRARHVRRRQRDEGQKLSVLARRGTCTDLAVDDEVFVPTGASELAARCKRAVEARQVVLAHVVLHELA